MQNQQWERQGAKKEKKLFFSSSGQGRRPAPKPRWRQLKARALLTMCSGLARWKMRRTRRHVCVCACSQEKAWRRAAAARRGSSFPCNFFPMRAGQSKERREAEYEGNSSRLPFYFRDKHAAPSRVPARTHGSVLLHTGGSWKTIYLCTTAGGRVHVSETK